MNTENSPRPSSLVRQSRGWIIAEGILFIIVGFVAITFPQLMTLVLEQFLGVLCVIIGVFTLGGLIFNRGANDHRLSSLLSGILEIAAGVVLIRYVPSGVVALTVILAALLTAEGIFSIAAAFKGKGKVGGWFWLLLSGGAALVLAFMIYRNLPNSAAWMIGLLYGINLLFSGFSFLFIGLGMKPSAEA
ncbi:MAG: HdeD family acid-resistance protein [Chthoniobacterales bacterium]